MRACSQCLNPTCALTHVMSWWEEEHSDSCKRLQSAASWGRGQGEATWASAVRDNSIKVLVSEEEERREGKKHRSNSFTLKEKTHQHFCPSAAGSNWISNYLTGIQTGRYRVFKTCGGAQETGSTDSRKYLQGYGGSTWDPKALTFSSGSMKLLFEQYCDLHWLM